MRSRKWLLFIIPPVLIIALSALVIVLYLNFHQPPQIGVTASGFTRSTVEINEGDSIRFVNQSGVAQVICIGSNKVCNPNAVTPAALKKPGVRLNPGQSMDIAFENYGTYIITRPALPGGNLRVTVDSAP